MMEINSQNIKNDYKEMNKIVSSLEGSPKFSIIIPMYNAEKTLDKCLKSILSQSFKNFEIICIDDGSTDNTAIALKKYSDIRLKYFFQEHQGVSKARNLGLKLAKGKYVLFCDADDEYLTEAFLILSNLLDEKSADILVCGAEVVNCSQKYKMSDIVTANAFFEKDEIIQAFFKERGTRPYIWNCVYYRETLNRKNIVFCEDLDLGEDQVFQFNCFFVADTLRITSIKIYRHYFSSESSVNMFYLDHPAFRLLKHCKIIDKIQYLVFSESLYVKKLFMKWVFNFLASDYIKLKYSEIKKIRPALHSTLNKLKPLKKYLSNKEIIKFYIFYSFLLLKLYKLWKKIK